MAAALALSAAGVPHSVEAQDLVLRGGDVVDVVTGEIRTTADMPQR